VFVTGRTPQIFWWAPSYSGNLKESNRVSRIVPARFRGSQNFINGAERFSGISQKKIGFWDETKWQHEILKKIYSNFAIH
jgi:hypothetical protein